MVEDNEAFAQVVSEQFLSLHAVTVAGSVNERIEALDVDDALLRGQTMSPRPGTPRGAFRSSPIPTRRVSRVRSSAAEPQAPLPQRTRQSAGSMRARQIPWRSPVRSSTK